MQDVHKTTTGNLTYRLYTFIPLNIENTKFRFCGKEYDSIEEVKKEIDSIIARKEEEG